MLRINRLLPPKRNTKIKTRGFKFDGNEDEDESIESESSQEDEENKDEIYQAWFQFNYL